MVRKKKASSAKSKSWIESVDLSSSGYQTPSLTDLTSITLLVDSDCDNESSGNEDNDNEAVRQESSWRDKYLVNKLKQREGQSATEGTSEENGDHPC